METCRRLCLLALSLPPLVNIKRCHPKEPWEKCFPSATIDYHPPHIHTLTHPPRRCWPTLAVTYWPAEKDRGQHTNGCCDYLCWKSLFITQLSILPPHPPLVPLPHTLFHIPSLPLKTAAQPEASKAGFTQQSSSRENGCCFQVLFAHLSGGDCSGENGVYGMLFF